jgi:ABC-type branched-subunit amino acid transport system substrate-binding protein
MPTTIDAMAFDAALAVKAALIEIQEPLVDRSRVRDHLRATNGLNGATGKISYRDGEFVRNLSTLTVLNGKFSAVK